jgi:hypothetical protein
MTASEPEVESYRSGVSRRQLAVLLLGLMVSAECVARVAPDGADPEGAGVDFVFDAYHLDSRLLRFAMSKGGGFEDEGVFMSINAQGRRGTDDHLLGRTPGRGRVVVVGTGNAYGFRVPDGATWPEQLDLALGEDVDVLNLAYPGSTVVYLDRSIADEAMELRPDVLVIAYAGYNEALLGDVPETDVVDPEASLANFLRGFALVRYAEGLLHQVRRSVTSSPRVPHVDVATYEALLVKQIERFRADGIAVVLLQEVAVYPDVAGYWRQQDMGDFRAAMDRVARSLGVPLFDPATVLPEPGAELDALFVSRLIYGSEACARIASGLASVVGPLLPSDPPSGESEE